MVATKTSLRPRFSPTLSVSVLATSLLLLAFSATSFAQTNGYVVSELTYTTKRGQVKTERNCRIASHDYTGMKVKIGRVERTLSESEVISLEYRRPPALFAEGLEALKGGDYRGALSAFQDHLAEDLKRSELWTREIASYQCYQISRRLGAYADSKKHRESVLKENAKSAYLPRMELNSARDLFGRGKHSDAIKAFADLAKNVTARSYDPKYGIEAGFGTFLTQLDAKNFKAAKTVLADVKGRTLSPEQSLLVHVYEGQLSLAGGDIEKAKVAFASTLAKADAKKTPRAFASASNGLGDCALAAKNWDQAVLEYSRTFALYYEADGLDHELAWSYFGFYSACKQIAASAEEQEDKEKSRLWLSRFKKTRERVAAEFRMTRGGQLALNELGG